ncbi:hypothetical protein EV361DRAFT_966944 [Lentinula raphanica]|nr:hypothetical protein EV361DRAFT_966944 [Lentinula raphanica]
MNGNLQPADEELVTDESVASMDETDAHENQTPDSPHGWGLHDVPGGWGPIPANGPSQQSHISHISRSKALRNLRSDFGNAGLSFEGERGRNTELDNLNTKLWASVQCYRSSDEGRKGGTSYPSFTGPQILQRLEEVETQLASRIHEHQSLVHQVFEMSSTLSTIEAREKQVVSDIRSLRDTQRELEDLKEIAYARLL